MEVLIIKDNKKVMDINTKRLGTLLKIFLTTITVDTSIIALIKLITVLSWIGRLMPSSFLSCTKIKKDYKIFLVLLVLN